MFAFEKYSALEILIIVFYRFYLENIETTMEISNVCFQS